MRGFLAFIREQGVAGLAVGFILGGAVSKLVSAIVTDIVNPLLAAAVDTTTLREKTVAVGSAELLWGDLLAVGIDFLVIAVVVYAGVKVITHRRLDKKG
jgi:large conductance mechanosensitive channel